MKQTFTFDGMNLAVQNTQLTAKIKAALRSGRYENAERSAITAHVKPDDRVLDLGGGIGATGIAAGKIVGGQNLMIVEANSDLIDQISENLESNEIRGATILNGAIVVTEINDQTAFYKAKGFWAGSLNQDCRPQSYAIQVPTHSLKTVLNDFKPTVIVCDTEGIEAEILASDLPSNIRLVIVELHPHLYPDGTTKALFDNMSRMGFSYLPKGSRGVVVCFGRKKAPSDRSLDA